MELGNMFFGNPHAGTFPLERGEWQDMFCRLFEGDHWATHEGPSRSEYTFENEVFITRPYDWNCEDPSPNFEYKPAGLKIWWYKYPLRDSYSDRPITFEELKAIVDHCIESLKGAGDE